MTMSVQVGTTLEPNIPKYGKKNVIYFQHRNRMRHKATPSEASWALDSPMYLCSLKKAAVQDIQLIQKYQEQCTNLEIVNRNIGNNF